MDNSAKARIQATKWASLNARGITQPVNQLEAKQRLDEAHAPVDQEPLRPEDVQATQDAIQAQIDSDTAAQQLKIKG